MAILGRTRAVADKLLCDIKKILFYTTIIVQCMFFAFYSYSIYNNINNMLFLVTYSLLFLLSIILFIDYLFTHNKSSKKNNRFKRVLRVFRYIINIVMIIVSAIEVINYNLSILNIVFLASSAISLFIQLIIELIRILTEKYVELFVISTQMDLSFVYKLAKLKDIKGNMYELLNVPLTAITNKVEDKEPQLSKEEKYVNKLTEEFNQKHKVEIEKKDNENKQKQKKVFFENINVIKNYLIKKKLKK